MVVGSDTHNLIVNFFYCGLDDLAKVVNWFRVGWVGKGGVADFPVFFNEKQFWIFFDDLQARLLNVDPPNSSRARRWWDFSLFFAP